MQLFLEKIQMFACSDDVCACRTLSTFRYSALFCCWFLIFDINCGVCWKDKFLLRTVLNIVDSSTPVQQSWNIPSFGIQWNVCLPDFEFLRQPLNSTVVSTLNILYEAKFLEIKKNEMKLSVMTLMIWVLSTVEVVDGVSWVIVCDGSPLNISLTLGLTTQTNKHKYCTA